MNPGLTPLLKAAIGFAYVGGFAFVAIGAYLTYRRRRLHPLLLVCIAAISISWIEAPYDWAMYAQFAPAIPRMPSWWPLDMTWGGLPASVPIGYVSYFVTPALVAAALGRRLSSRFHWRRPITLLGVGTRRWLPLGLLVQRDPGGTARCLLLRPRDPRACAVAGDQTSVPPLRRPRHGRDGDGLRLHPRTDGSRRSHRHRSVGPREFAEPSLVDRTVHRWRRGRRKSLLRGGLHASSRGEVGGPGDRWTHDAPFSRSTEPAASGRDPPGSLTERRTSMTTPTTSSFDGGSNDVDFDYGSQLILHQAL